MNYAEGKAIVMHAMDRLRMVGLVDFSVMLYLIHLSRIKTFQVSRLEYPRRQIETLLFSYDIEDSEILKVIFKIFNDDIVKIDSQAFYDVLNPLAEINEEWYSKHYISIFEELLFKIVSNQYSYEFLQPLEITKLISKLSGYNKNGVVYNPFAGLASYGIEMNVSSGYIAEELNERTWAIGVLRLLAHDINTDNYICQDSILKWRS